MVTLLGFMDYGCPLPYTVLFRPIVHVTHYIRKKLFLRIRLKSKENLSAISVELFPNIVNDRQK